MVELSGLENGEELLGGRAIEAIWPSDHHWDAEGGHCPAGFLTAVNFGAIEHDNGIVSPVWVLTIEVDDQSVKKGAKYLTVDGRLCDREETLAEVVDGRDERQLVAQRVLDWPECLAIHAPALADEVSPSQTCLVDVDDALASSHHLDQFKGEALPLYPRVQQVRSIVDGPGPLEP